MFGSLLPAALDWSLLLRSWCTNIKTSREPNALLEKMLYVFYTKCPAAAPNVLFLQEAHPPFHTIANRFRLLC